jgi:Sec-independent protein secretion pathway component TatC
MNLKKLGKRVLYFVGGILIVFVCSIILATYISDGGSWFTQIAIYLCLAILFGLALFIVSLFPKLDEPPKPKKTPDEKTNDQTNI